MGGPREEYVFYTQFDLVNMGSANAFFRTKMAPFSGSFWVSVSSLLLILFRFFSKILFRYIKDESSQMNNSSCSSLLPPKNDQIDSNLVEPEVVMRNKSCSEISAVRGSGDEDLDGKEMSKPDFAFTFKFPTYEDFSRSHTGNGDYQSVSEDKLSYLKEESEVKSGSNKYDFQSRKNFSYFFEEAQVSSFEVKELYADPNGTSLWNEEVSHSGFLSENDFGKQVAEAEASGDEASSGYVDDACKEEEAEELKFKEDSHSVNERSENHRKDFTGKEEDFNRDDKFLSDSNYMGSDSDSDSITSSHEFSFMSQFIASTSDGFLSDLDFEGLSEHGALRDIDERNFESEKNELDFEENDFQVFNVGLEADDYDEEEDEDMLEELRKLEESEKFSGKDFSTHNEPQTEEYEAKAVDVSDNSKKSNEENPSACDVDDSNKLETLWEHQELIEQLKMELRKVRATGLPTILEESESPKITEDLKPWKIDEKFQHGDKMCELHKFYKSYRERMRKFDILNYQKMYALGLLQSKDPLQSFSSRKSPTLWGCKRKKPQSDQMMKFIKELQSDLEMVYVGQLCLSWEFLQWQYEKTFEIWESDPYGLRQYNEVADEFQQFQVLLHRFIENEPFQGPRVENYVKNRCVMRHLLQVPVIREDSKERKKARRRGRDNGAITSDMILEILEESIRTIWRFIRADKYAYNLVSKSRKGMELELQDPADSDLLMTVQTEFQKKDKRLKDLLRSGNCILKKFQKHQEDGLDHIYFFSQVDMKLVSRVLNMSRITTEQLVWCYNKLSKINFVKRKIHVEPSFLLFPC